MCMNNKYKKGLISIITPVFNGEKFINDSIRSVLSQSYENWELLIVDDKSTDSTESIISNYLVKDKRVRYFKNEINLGPAGARNVAISNARGSYIAFLDVDDMWVKDKLQLTLDQLDQSKAPLVYTSYQRIDENFTKVGRKINIPLEIHYRELLGNTAICTSTVLINREVTGDFLMEEVYYDDFVAWLNILKRYGAAVGLNESLTLYRVVGGSISRNKIKSAKEVWKIYRKSQMLSPAQSFKFLMFYMINSFKKYSRF